MKALIRQLIVVAAVVILAQACAWSAVSINLGGNTINLQLRNNPDYTGWPGLEPNSYEWYGVLPMTFSTTDPIVVTGGGDFKNGSGTIVNYIRLEQDVTNSTNVSWTDFHATCTGSEFAKISKIQQGWDGILRDDFVTLDFYKGTGSPIAPSQNYTDGFVLWIDVDGTGNGNFTLSSVPTYAVPEPSSIATMLCGMAGLIGAIKRRIR
jgi:hypothetical protein